MKQLNIDVLSTIIAIHQGIGDFVQGEVKLDLYHNESNPRVTHEVIDGLTEEEYEFFSARDTILSYFIFSDAIGRMTITSGFELYPAFVSLEKISGNNNLFEIIEIDDDAA